MALPPVLASRLRIPVIGSPLFIISGPELVIAQCKAGVVGSFPTLNARPVSQLDEWLAQITEELADWDRKNPDRLSAPFAVNQIVHKTNNRLEQDVELAVKYKVPVTITSLGAREDVNEAMHSAGGIVLHDVINSRFARKAVEKVRRIGKSQSRNQAHQICAPRLGQRTCNLQRCRAVTGQTLHLRRGLRGVIGGGAVFQQAKTRAVAMVAQMGGQTDGGVLRAAA